jgi:ATP-dependent RNA helicase RhlE
MTEFPSFGLDAELLRGVSDLGFIQPTPIQQDAIPPAMEGRDLVACAMTGSGKTAAFLLPILHQLLTKPRGTTRALVVAPTRELAAQVNEHLTAFAAHTNLTGAAIYGGVAMGPQEAAFRSGVDVLIATPGRLLDHLQHSYARLDTIEFLVLDEADRMLDMGFLPDVRRVLEQLPKKRQTLLFSATLPSPIVTLAREMLVDPVTLNVERKATTATGITEAIYPVSEELKPALLIELLKRGEIKNVLVFTRTKHRCNRLTDYLTRQGVSCDRIHGNRSQAQRTDSLARFKDGSIQVLVATDIAARGIDVEALSHVINFDVPNVPDDYIHRVGRTARAEATGDAFTFVAPQESAELQAIERALGRRLTHRSLPGFDYSAVPAERFEIPLTERIATIRARKAEERARAREKAQRKTERQTVEDSRRPGAGRPADGPPARAAAPRHPAGGSRRPQGRTGRRTTDARRPEVSRSSEAPRPEQRRGGDGQEPPRKGPEPKWLQDPEERLKKALTTFRPRFNDRAR